MKNSKYALLLAVLVFILSGCGKKNVFDAGNKNDSLKNKTTAVNTDSKNETDAKTIDAGSEKVEFKCSAMYCSGCEDRITEEVKKLDGVKDVKADSKAKIVSVIYDKSKLNKTSIEKSINAAGYDTEDSKAGNKHDCEKEGMKQ